MKPVASFGIYTPKGYVRRTVTRRCLEDLLPAARHVIESWEHGDLALAVSNLADAIENLDR